MYCVYLTVYSGDKLPKRYIGSTTIDNIKQGYNGTIKSKKYRKIFLEEQEKNKNLFRTRILSMHSLREDALIEELRLHIKYNVVKSNKYMNMSLASPKGCFGRDVTGSNHPMYNKSHSEETKKQISETLKKKYQDGNLISPYSYLRFYGESNHFFGKKHSEESKQKMRKPKTFVPKFKCPHCQKEYDGGNLKQHMLRNGFTLEDIENAKSVG